MAKPSSTMHYVLSNCVDAPTFARLALALAREGADMLLCHPAPDGGGMPPGWTIDRTRDAGRGPGTPCCIVGYGVAGEIAPDPRGDMTALADFCFRRGTTPMPGHPHAAGSAARAPALDGVPRLTLGWLSYGWGLALHGVASDKHPELPLGVLRRYHCLLRWYPHDGALTAETSPTGATTPLHRVRRLLAGLGQASAGCGQDHPGGPAPDLADATPAHTTGNAPHPGHQEEPLSHETLGPLDDLVPSLDGTSYPDGVRAVLAHIRKGDTYQLNLTSRFTTHRPGLDPAALLLRLWLLRPAPFAGYVHAGSRRILSLSPERFLRVAAGEVLAQPIKGTRTFAPRSSTPAEREALEAGLRSDPKERAELSMVVDLLRNDISAACAYGSVTVPRHCATFAVGPLIQMCSDVRGRLRPGVTCLDLLRDAFPGGSVTGCPKPRTMSIIESIEPHPRDVYCGSLIAVGDEHEMDSSIAIRTALYDTATGRLHLYAGSGLTVESDPEGEYRETLAKTGAFREKTA